MITFIAAATSVHKGSNLAVMTVCYACSLRKKFTSTKTQKGLRFLKTDIIIELKEPSRRVIFLPNRWEAVQKIQNVQRIIFTGDDGPEISLYVTWL